MIALSQDHFAEACCLMSMGKLMQGLIHNLNGPLQNLGMDMDMITLSLDRGGDAPQEILAEIRTRLLRMEDEFERINRLIRTAASRFTADTDPGYLSLGGFLEQELDFLKANLYFKHQVNKELRLDEPLPMLSALADGVPEGLRSLLEAVSEDMERRELTSFLLEAHAGEGSVVEVRLTAGEGRLSSSVLEALSQDISGTEVRIIAPEQMAATNAVAILARAGVHPEVESGAGETRIVLSMETTS